MERIIRFRARILNTKNNSWVGGDLLHDGGKTFIRSTIRGTDTQVDAQTICEYSGMHDSNNTPIYEHDIISIGEGREPCEVVFENGCFKAVNGKGIHIPLERGIEYYSWKVKVLGSKLDKKDDVAKLSGNEA